MPLLLSIYGGLTENGPHRLRCLNMWFLSETVWMWLGGMAFLTRGAESLRMNFDVSRAQPFLLSYLYLMLLDIGKFSAIVTMPWPPACQHAFLL